MSSANPVLVESLRGGQIESRFRGSVVLVDSGGKVLWSKGSTDDFVFPRSAIKYFQVMPLILSGAADHFGFSPEEIALMCASHAGEHEHIRVARAILAKAGLEEEDLGCGSHNPTSVSAYENLIRMGGEALPVHNNCSGKHGGFLALAKFLGAPTESYLDMDHPVQLQIREVLARFCEMDLLAFQVGIDGCSAPNFALPLRNLALGFKNLAIPSSDPHLENVRLRVLDSVWSNPFMVGGTARYCTDLMRNLPGKVIAKLGADGIYGLGIPGMGLGLAVKMDDGALGPQYQVVQAILEQLGLVPDREKEALSGYKSFPLLNFRGKTVGERRLAPDFFEGWPGN